jgi:hypothetical protein
MKIAETEFAHLRWLFTTQPRNCWHIALDYSGITANERDIITSVLNGPMEVQHVLGKTPAQLPTDRVLSKQELSDLYTKSGRGPVAVLGRPVTELRDRRKFFPALLE